MADKRKRPYEKFNFIVDMGTGNGSFRPAAGFQEVSGIGMDVSVDEYRNGHESGHSNLNITGINTSAGVTLKRGVVGSLELGAWMDQIRTGDRNACRTVVIQLLNEDHTAVVHQWKLSRTRIVRTTGSPLNAKGTDVAMEELVLACERVEMD
jgi:phage tail-like protein